MKDEVLCTRAAGRRSREKWLNLGYILKIELIDFVGGFHVRQEQKRGVRVKGWDQLRGERRCE